MARILFVVTEDWALVTHRLHLVKAALAAGHTVGVATRMSGFGDEFTELGIEVFPWSLSRRSLGPLNALRSVISLRKIIGSFKPDLIHAVALKPVIFAGIGSAFAGAHAILSALGGVGYVFSSKSVKARLLRIPVVLGLKLALAGRRKALVLQNQDDLELMSSLRVASPDKLRLIRGAGVETDLFPESSLPTGKVVVSLPARLLWDKGVGEFVKVARAVTAKRSNVVFQLVGDLDSHNPMSITERHLKKWIGEGCIQHFGRVAHTDMPSIYRASTIVCLPSYREGLPKVLLEAASTGRPIISFDVSGCREIVRSGINGFIVPFGDIEQLESVITRLIDDTELCEQFGRAGRELVIREFSSEAINVATFEVWRDLLK